MLDRKLAVKERKARNHRLIVRGAVFESIVPDAKDILAPIQAYVGKKTDMNKANEIRPIFRRLADVAERTGCAVILIGHLNKAAGGQSAYRGLGSIDFRAAPGVCC